MPIALLSLWLSIPGCRPASDPEAAFDRTALEWQQSATLVDPIEFLESGHAYNHDPEIHPGGDYDREFFVPLLKRLRREARLEFIGVVDEEDPQRLFAVLSPLPASEPQRNDVRRILEDEQRRFAGLVFDQWGHAWLGLDYVHPDDAAALEGSQKER